MTTVCLRVLRLNRELLESRLFDLQESFQGYCGLSFCQVLSAFLLKGLHSCKCLLDLCFDFTLEGSCTPKRSCRPIFGEDSVASV